MSDREALDLREKAQSAFQSQDDEIFRLHENAVAALLDAEIAEDVRLAALLRTREWELNGNFTEEHVAAWRSILAMEDDEAKQAILADSEDAVELRRGTPFTRLALHYPNG